MVHTAHMSGYMKPNSKTRFTTKFYDHYKALETKLVNPRGKKGGIFSLKELTDNKELVDARKVWLIRRLAEEHAPELLCDAEAVTAQPGRTKDALRRTVRKKSNPVLLQSMRKFGKVLESSQHREEVPSEGTWV